jgi:hypothetical protein
MGVTTSDLTGQRFTRYVVLGSAERRNKIAYWHVRCDCGEERVVRGYSLTHGESRSCGCYALEARRKRSTKHGGYYRPEYHIWSSMKARCSNPDRDRYGCYGARGITVCDRWAESFQNFFDDMGPRPSARHSIERDDVNGNYEPSNCRWATATEQANNRRNTVRLTVGGRSQTLAEWSEETGIAAQVLGRRLRKGYAAADVVSHALSDGRRAMRKRNEWVATLSSWFPQSHVLARQLSIAFNLKIRNVYRVIEGNYILDSLAVSEVESANGQHE